jgi:large subunit ribosomal protein L6
MSRVGKLPVQIPSGVNVELDNERVVVSGSKGSLSMNLTDSVNVIKEDGAIKVSPRSADSFSRSMWGTTRNRINNMVNGVSTGFSRQLEIRGVGYRAAINGKMLTMSLGFSHEIKFIVPSGIDLKVEKQTQIDISGIDIEKVSRVAAEIRSLRKPEPYKGKGIRYSDEYVRSKEGKKK